MKKYLIKMLLLPLFFALKTQSKNDLNKQIENELEAHEDKIELGMNILKIRVFSPFWAKSSKSISLLYSSIKIDIEHMTQQLRNASINFNAKISQKIHTIDPLEQRKLVSYAFYGMARQFHKKNLSTQLTFVIEDDDKNSLALFFASCPGAYAENTINAGRCSSHFKEYLPELPIKFFGLTLFNINGIVNGLDIGGMPNNKEHILFGQLPPIKEGGNNRLLWKPEDHGTVGLRPFFLHAVSFCESTARKTKPIREFFNMHHDDDFNKERVPEKILKYYISIIEKLESNEDLKNYQIQEARTYGIFKMIETLHKYVKAADNNNNNRQQDIHSSQSIQEYIIIENELFNDGITDANEFIKKINDEFDNIELGRKGQEIIFSQEELRQALFGRKTHDNKNSIDLNEVD